MDQISLVFSYSNCTRFDQSHREREDRHKADLLQTREPMLQTTQNKRALHLNLFVTQFK